MLRICWSSSVLEMGFPFREPIHLDKCYIRSKDMERGILRTDWFFFSWQNNIAFQHNIVYSLLSVFFFFLNSWSLFQCQAFFMWQTGQQPPGDHVKWKLALWDFVSQLQLVLFSSLLIVDQISHCIEMTIIWFLSYLLQILI